MNKNATTQLHIYSAFFVLAGFVLNRGVFLLFLAEKGMSVTEIALYQALFNIATVVLELPTGLIGDFFGKKFSIQVGVLLLFFHTAGMLLLSGPFLVVLSLVEALAYSLQSGSEQALLYEIARNARSRRALPHHQCSVACRAINRYGNGNCARIFHCPSILERPLRMCLHFLSPAAFPSVSH